jgi:protein-disulfide isomerase
MVFTAVSVILALVSTLLIKSYCLLCIASYVVNLSLVFSCWIVIRRFSHFEMISGIRKDFLFLWTARRRSLPVLIGIVLATVSVKIALPGYWELVPGSLGSQVLTGVTAEGHPWIGAADPDVTITEFTDYQCFQCKKMHYYLRQLIAEYPDQIRLVHRQFPMDHEFNPLVEDSFHVGSGSMALLATAAASFGKFWEANDYLFQQAKIRAAISIKDMARRIGVDAQELSRRRYDQEIKMRLWQDIKEGLKLKVLGTPAYLIDEALYLGQIPSKILKEIIQH